MDINHTDNDNETDNENILLTMCPVWNIFIMIPQKFYTNSFG